MIGMLQIILKNGQIALIDEADMDLLKTKWAITSGRYARHFVNLTGTSFAIEMHRLVLERKIGRTLNVGEVCDHINGNGLDNRRSNLRVSTQAQNRGNSKRPITNTSGYKGVYLHKSTGRWNAKIRVNYKLIDLGLHDTPETAFNAYCEAARKYRGEFARFD